LPDSFNFSGQEEYPSSKALCHSPEGHLPRTVIFEMLKHFIANHAGRIPPLRAERSPKGEDEAAAETLRVTSTKV
jgi:hypothetical protein